MTKKNLSKSQCSICKNVLPLDGLFCQYCDPPLPPEAFPESNLGFGQTCLQFLIIIILFISLIFYKMEIPLAEIWHNMMGIKNSNSMNDNDINDEFKIIHFVKVNLANVRINPKLKEKVVMVLRKGDQVHILDTLENWTQIRAYEKIGWIYSDLLESKVQLDQK